MPIDIAHLLGRLAEPFNTESRFYWPLFAGVLLAMVANVGWYYTRLKDDAPSPAEEAVRPWVFWVNAIVLFWFLVLMLAKPPFYVYLVSLAVDALALAYVYYFWLPPRDRAWERELRRLKYIPKPERRKRRRR